MIETIEPHVANKGELASRRAMHEREAVKLQKVAAWQWEQLQAGWWMPHDRANVEHYHAFTSAAARRHLWAALDLK